MCIDIDIYIYTCMYIYMLRYMHSNTSGMLLCAIKALSLSTAGVVGTSSPAAKVTALHRFTLQASRLHSCSKFNMVAEQ